MHWPAGDGTSLDGYWETLLALKREGKVGAVGLSNHNLAQLQDAEALGHVDSLQPPFSAIQRSAAADLIPWCEAHGTGVIVYSPMQSGLLSGGFSEARAASLPADDWRSRHAEFRAPALQRNLALAQAFRPVAERHGATVSRRRGGLDPSLAGRDRCDRRRAQRGAGGRLCWALPNSSWMMRIWRASPMRSSGRARARGRRVRRATSRPCPTICSARVG